MNTIHRLAIGLTIILTLLADVRAQDDAGGSRLEEVTRDMKVASDHLAKKTTDKPTQSAQESAVEKLDALIAELERRKSGLGNGARPMKPADQSMVRSGPGGMGELQGTRTQGERWGELPAHERDRILQSLTEGFPPHYQAVLEAYYKRLAAEKKAEDPGLAEPRPATAPKPVMKNEMKSGNSKPVAIPSTAMQKSDKKNSK